VIAPKLSLEVPGLSLSMEALEQTYVAMGYSEPYAQYTPALVAPPLGLGRDRGVGVLLRARAEMGLALKLYPTRPETGVQRERSDAISVDMEKQPTTDEIFARSSRARACRSTR
jgi:hypothetical protein